MSLFQENENELVFHIISQHWEGPGIWNPSLLKTMLLSYCILNTKVPVAMVLTIYGFRARGVNSIHG